MNIQYRPEIDGLRAVAVAVVVFFHAGFPGFSGGFVGVDVFFVISGYLIAAIILKAQGEGRFSLRQFYHRRVRRLTPPLVFMLIPVTVAAWLLLSPGELLDYAMSLGASALFVSNWYFLAEAGYFDGPSEYKPLLHTWSLAIEEQFYLVFPALMIALARFGRRAALIALGALALVSLILADRWAVSYPDTGFYHSLGRFWELLAGVLLAVAGTGLAARLPAWARGALTLAGLAMIGAAVIAVDPEAVFPGRGALLPVLGSVLIIFAADGARDWAGRALASAPMVYIGKLSYALYLWHWPIFVFIRYVWPAHGHWHMIAGTALALALSAVSYHVIENPVRARRVLGRARDMAGLFAASSAAALAFAVLALRTDGFADRFPETVAEYEAWLEAQRVEFREAGRVNECWLNGFAELDEPISACLQPNPDRRSVVVFGDSHSAQLLAGLQHVHPDHDFHILAVNSCFITTSETVINTRPACHHMVEYLLNGYTAEGFDAVIIATSLANPNLFDDYVANILTISAATSAPVHAMGPIYFVQPNMPSTFPTNTQLPRARLNALFADGVRPQHFAADTHLREAFAGTGVNYISALDHLCPSGPRSCRFFTESGWPALIDNSHMGPEASRELVRDLRDSGALSLAP